MPKIKKEFDQTKYQNEYKKKTYDRMELLVPKGEKAVIKEKAAAVVTSVNEFVYSAVKEKMEAMEAVTETEEYHGRKRGNTPWDYLVTYFLKRTRQQYNRSPYRCRKKKSRGIL